MAQAILAGTASNGFHNGSTIISEPPRCCWNDGWDAKEAKFRLCFLPVVDGVPAALALVILAIVTIGLLVKWRPAWTRPFVEEHVGPTPDFNLDQKRSWNRATILLASVSIAGFVLHLATAIHSAISGQALQRSTGDRANVALAGLLPAVTWAVILGLMVAYRPKTAPISVLVLLIIQTATYAIVVADHFKSFESLGVGVETTMLVLTIACIGVVLSMPLRDPEMPSKDISQPHTESTSSLRSPEDDLSLWQFMTVSWMTPLIRIGNKRQLQDEDVWQLGYEFQHRRLHENFRQLKGTVVQRLVQANGIDLFILTMLGILELVANFAVPVLLQQILAAMEDPSAPKSAAIRYAALSLAIRLAATQSGVFSLWFGRRCYERSRGEMITMLYEKTLGRKISFQSQEKESDSDQVDGTTSVDAQEPEVTTKRAPAWWTKAKQRLSSLFSNTKAVPTAEEPASMGKILNLMRNDVYEVAQRFWEFQSLITKPLSCVFSIVLVVRFLGWPSLIAVLALIMAQLLNAGLARIMIHFEKKRRAATDSKLQVISQFVEAIRHLRWYGWQGAWLEQILEARQQELNLKVITNIWNVTIGAVNSLALDLTPVVAFFAYTVIAGKELRVDIAFPAIQLFGMMTQSLRDLPNLIIVLINAWVAVARIEDFMAEPDREMMNTEALVGDSLALQKASFSWPGVAKLVLKDVDVSFPEGLTVVRGEVGSGKTALLQALLGELDMHKGQLIGPPEPVGYCAQAPWLQSMSVRENILFSEPYEDKRYKDVLDACALTPDLAEFKAGDLSLIGENGIGLSGGQKARIALARAVYSRTKILLLDDPISALDQQTAESIVQKLFSGPLVQGRTIVMVTHRTDLVLAEAGQIVRMVDGEARILDHNAAAYDSLQRTVSTQSGEGDQQVIEERATAAVPDKFIEEEHRAEGGVQLRVYWEYIKAGRLRWWALLVLVLSLYRLMAVGETWFLKAWGEAYSERSSIRFLVHQETVTSTLSGILDGLPSPETNIRPWLLGFLFIALALSTFYIVSQAIMLVIVYVAARRMFKNIMEKVTNATFRFYDVTPVGRLMNRMTSDIGVIDGNISQQFQVVAWLGISWISSVVVIGSVTPAFLAFSAVLTIAFVMIFLRFLPTSQSLRRLEMVSLTPLMSNFGALLNGLATVRAFRAQSRFQDRVIEVVDTFQKMDHFYWSLQAWLMYRFDALSALSTFLLTALALITNVSAGLTAFVLVAANKFVNSTHYLCRQYGQLQMEFVSVERVVELLHLEQEPSGDIAPPAWWPSRSGDIRFDDVLIKYAPHLDPALAGISFTIKGGSKTAVIGRTGSGKSTLALAMLATILPESGKITIDNIDLASVDKQALRSRVTFLAQDPVLFPGTMRENLDPVEEHSDEDCELVLRRVCERQGWDLKTKIEAGGRNLSQGQRQLVGLARAVLRRSAIIILDEATASIDRETAMQIQQVMHEEMKDSTVITIAHRLEAVRHADYCVVLGKGKILEQGPASDMLKHHTEDMVDDASQQ
ncbi:ABC bile acid transporter [Hortaea werneckii]|nr:ABC bile acid transporter [Hortaea werneckii]